MISLLFKNTLQPFLLIPHLNGNQSILRKLVSQKGILVKSFPWAYVDFRSGQIAFQRARAA